MISTDCHIESFLAAIEGKPSDEAVLLAHQEATEVQRRLLHARTNGSEAAPYSDVYVNDLKEFIGFIRYAVMKNRVPTQPHHKLFRCYMKNI